MQLTIQPVFLDTNVPLYAGGREHALRDSCRRIIQAAAIEPNRFVTDAEVLQELLHRFIALRLWPAGGDVFHTFSALMAERVEPMSLLDVQRAAVLAAELPGIAARDLIHVAIMNRLGLSRIISANRDFDRIPGIARLDPADVDSWYQTVTA